MPSVLCVSISRSQSVSLVALLTFHCATRVDASLPIGVAEVLMVQVVDTLVQHNRRALRTETVLERRRL